MCDRRSLEARGKCRFRMAATYRLAQRRCRGPSLRIAVRILEANAIDIRKARDSALIAESSVLDCEYLLASSTTSTSTSLRNTELFLSSHKYTYPVSDSSCIVANHVINIYC